MLTNKKIDFKTQEKEAIIEKNRNAKEIAKRTMTRKTRLTRIREDFHDRLKAEAREQKITISKLLDDVCGCYYKQKKLNICQ